MLNEKKDQKQKYAKPEMHSLGIVNDMTQYINAGASEVTSLSTSG